MGDFTGIGKVIEMVGEQFGRFWEKTLLLAVALAIFSIAIYFFWGLLVVPIYMQALDLFAAVNFGITVDNLSAILATILTVLFIILGVMIPMPYLTARLTKGKRVPQSAIDALARLRSDGIHDVYNQFPKSDADLIKWKKDSDDWRDKVIAELDKNFTEADKLSFQRMGIVPLFSFDRAFNREHNTLVNHFQKRLTILEEIIFRYSIQ